MRSHLLHLFLAAVLLVSIPHGAVAITQPVPAAGQTKVSAALQTRLQTADAPASVLVMMADQLDLDAALAAQPPTAAPHARITAAYAALTTHAAADQAALRSWLEERNVPYRPYYVANMIRLTADSALIAEIAQRDDVGAIVDNPRVYQALAVNLNTLIDGWQAGLDVAPAAAVQSRLMPYGLSATKAVDVWALGFTGQGIVLASQDTGVEWTHPALRERYRGWDSQSGTTEHRYNWFDAWDTAGRPVRCASDAQVPCDDNGHGTHTVGTMLGNANDTYPRMGMAPDAEWIGCRNMEEGFGKPASYAACFEFFLAPYPQGGDPFVDGRPDLAPHVINNSWGCPPSEGCDPDTLQQVVENVRTAGIFVVSSAGNYGFLGCESVVDPIAIYDAALSVGAHSVSGTLAPFSSRGPVAVDDSGRIKPDITAPGMAVESTYLNDGYEVLQGTSMASPHVAGAVALLWSAAPDLIRDVEATEQIILKSAEPVPTNLCTGAEAVTPNNLFGYGRLDALAAVNMARRPWEITMTVTTAEGAPRADTAVEMVDAVTGYTYTTTTSATGVAQMARIYAGDYVLYVETATDKVTLGTISLQGEMASQGGKLTTDAVVVQYAALLDTTERGRAFLPLITR